MQSSYVQIVVVFFFLIFFYALNFIYLTTKNIVSILLSAIAHSLLLASVHDTKSVGDI
jgi:hypothetical protein